MRESWHNEGCPKCDTVNWFCNGDESNLSGVDLDGYKCRKCGHIELLGIEPCEELGGWRWDDKEDCNWDLGLETPS